jgi:uncharacterized protein (DUF58 family)
MFLANRSIVVALGLAITLGFWPFGPIAAGTALLALFCAMAFFDYTRAARAADLQIELDNPQTVSVGQVREISIRLHNPTYRLLRVGIHLQAPPSLGLANARRNMLIVPNEWWAGSVTFQPSVRGFLPLGPLTVRTLGPWAVAGRQEIVDLTRRVKVYPALPGRRQIGLRLNKALFLKSGVRSSDIRGEGTTFDSLRQYHPDDEFRRINWQATARANEPISNVYRQERNQHLLILIDAGRTMATSIAGYSRYEYAMDACIGLAELAGHLGDHVGAMAFAARPKVVVPPRSGRAHARLILDQLFDLSPSLEAPNYRIAFARLVAQFPRRALLVMLTELTEPAAMETLFQAMPALVSRHLVMVASITDPAIRLLTAAAANTSQDAYLKAAAEESLLNRERAAVKLRALGATVIDQDPADLPGRLAEEYLRVKAHGRL